MAKNDVSKIIQAEKQSAKLAAENKKIQADADLIVSNITKSLEEQNDFTDQSLKLHKELLNIIKEIRSEDSLIEDMSIKAAKAQKDGKTALQDQYEISIQQALLSKKALENEKKLNEFQVTKAPDLKKLLELEKKITKQRKISNDIANQAVKPFKIVTDMLREIPVLGSLLDPVLTDIEEKLTKSLSDKAHSKIFKTSVDEAVKLRGELQGAGKGIQGLDGILGKSADASEELASGMEASSASSAGLLSGLSAATLGTVAAVAAAGYLVKRFNDVRDKAIDISREQSLSKDDADAFAQHLRAAQLDATKYGLAMGAAAKEIEDGQKQFSDMLQTSNMLTMTNLQMSGYLQKNMNLTAEEANSFLQATALSGNAMDKNVVLVQNLTKEFNENTHAGIRVRDVVKDIGKLTATTVANYKSNLTTLTSTILLLKQYGLGFEQAQKSADAILNVEDSINSEMEARVLTGKNINLNQARYLALTGQTGEALQEMLNQVKSYSEVEKMLPIQRESLAKAIGMTSDELLNSLKKQELLNKLGREQVEIIDSMTTADLKKAEVQSTGAKQEAIQQELAARSSTKASELTAAAMGKLSIWLDKQLNLKSTSEADAEAKDLYGTKQTIIPKTPSQTLNDIDNGIGGGFYNQDIEHDFIYRPGQAPLSFDRDDIIIGATNPFGQSSNNTSNSDGATNPFGQSSNNTSNSDVVMLLKQLIAKVDQPVQFNIGGRVIDELDSRITMRKNYNTKVDAGYGTFG
jgi:hypothetical protein